MTWQQSLNQYYNHIYVLTLERAKERQQRMSQTLEGLSYSFFFGADKNNFSVDDLKAKGIYSETLAKQHHRYSKPMSGGQIGCSWSHRNICEDMLRNNYERVLIFEDDILLNTQALPLIPQILNTIPADCELLYWGYGKQEQSGFSTFIKQQWYHIQHAIGLLKWNHRMIRNLYPKKITPHLAIAGFHDYTYAFAINRSAAQKLIQLQTPIQFIADNLLAHAITNQHIKACITLPKIFLHDDLPGGGARDSFIQEGVG
jgi:glycosyl transferase, family 25